MDGESDDPKKKKGLTWAEAAKVVSAELCSVDSRETLLFLRAFSVLHDPGSGKNGSANDPQRDPEGDTGGRVTGCQVN